MMQESLVFHCPGEMGSHRGLGLTSSVVTEEKAEKMGPGGGRWVDVVGAYGGSPLMFLIFL